VSPRRPRKTGKRVRVGVRFGVGGGSPWVACSQDTDDRIARDDRLSTDTRLLAAARSRLEPQGHAHFKRGELSRILSQVNKTTGEIGPMSSNGLRRAIRKLSEAGLLLSDSWSQCLRVPLTDVQNGNGYNSECPTKPDASPLVDMDDSPSLVVVSRRLVIPSGSARGGVRYSGAASSTSPWRRISAASGATPPVQHRDPGDRDDGRWWLEDDEAAEDVDWQAVAARAEQERSTAGPRYSWRV